MRKILRKHEARVDSRGKRTKVAILNCSDPGALNEKRGNKRNLAAAHVEMLTLGPKAANLMLSPYSTTDLRW